MKVDPEKQYIHELQMESVEVQDDDNKKDGEADNKEDNVETKNKIDIKKIADIIVGLKTYEANIDKDKLVEYIKYKYSHKEPSVNIWKLICAVVLIYINV